MAAKHDYTAEAVEACKSVLIELAHVMDELRDHKDAYDIFYAARHFPGGPAALAAAFGPHVCSRLVREGLENIRAQFISVDHTGPTWVADFLGTTDPEERSIRRRQAYETVAEWLDALPGSDDSLPLS
jgi:hypothetical protein